MRLTDVTVEVEAGGGGRSPSPDSLRRTLIGRRLGDIDLPLLVRAAQGHIFLNPGFLPEEASYGDADNYL